jgi:hypothetical protein
MTALFLSRAILGRQGWALAIARHGRAALMALFLCSSPLFAQNVLQNLGRSDMPNGPVTIHTGELPYTIRSGDFRLLVSPSIEMDWNDNINGVSSSPQQDFILQPSLQLTGTYPVTEHNILNISLGIGYAEYLEHPIYNGLRINAGSQVAFDVYVEDFRFNFHDSAQESQDTGAQGGVAGTALYGGLLNSFGVTTTWNLHDLILSLGIDQNNYLASSSLFDYLNYSSQNPVARAIFQFRPNFSAGLETSASFTSYSEEVLNNSQIYSAGVLANWNPDKYFVVNAHAGYAIYDYGQTSQSGEIFEESPTGGTIIVPVTGPLRTANQNSWYAMLALTHHITRKIDYNLTFNEQIVPGVQSDASKVTSVILGADWAFSQALTFHSSVDYEHGQQGQGNLSGNLSETYNFVNASLTANYAITKAISMGLSYRRALRYSNLEGGTYAQDLVSLNLTYRFL